MANVNNGIMEQEDNRDVISNNGFWKGVTKKCKEAKETVVKTAKKAGPHVRDILIGAVTTLLVAGVVAYKCGDTNTDLDEAYDDNDYVANPEDVVVTDVESNEVVE